MHLKHPLSLFFKHCSAGVGRTGTYIALDALYHIGKQTGKVNVAYFVKNMRGNRMTMVQTIVSSNVTSAFIRRELHFQTNYIALICIVRHSGEKRKEKCPFTKVCLFQLWFIFSSCND